ncbi:hypothetical protein ACFL6U_30240 [Planctomycetota bacterium]
MRGRNISICCFLSLVSIAVANDAVERQVKGRGPTRDKAIQNALLNAVTQVHGAAVSTGIANVDMTTGAMDSVRDPMTGNRYVGVDHVSVQSAGTLTLMETRGLIKSYEVVQEQNLGDQGMEVTAKVWVYDYHSPEDIKPLRLAVIPAEVTAASCTFGRQVVPNDSISRQITQLVSGALSQNDQFTLLDRESNATLRQERQVLSDSSVPLKEKSRLYSTLGSDYLVSMVVSQAELLVTDVNNPAINRTTRRYDAKVAIEYRLLVGPTRQIVLADDFRIRLEDSQIKGLTENWRADRIDEEELRRNFLNMAATRVARAVTDYLQPVKVAAVVAGPRVVLSQGGNRFIENDLYEVFQLGQAIVDPDTQKELARHEERLGTLRIGRVLSKICYAEVVDGEFNTQAVGAICRWSSGLEGTPRQSQGGRGTKTKQTSSGGVKLPFDR